MGATAALTIGAGLLGFQQVKESKKAEKAANEQANRVREQQDKIRADLDGRASEENSNAAQSQQQARERQKARARSSVGRSSTILTGQLGDVSGGGSSSGKPKSLLGI